MMKGSWGNLTLLCGNHDYDVEMKITQGPHSLFYGCPEYKSIYGDDHEGRSCNNRLNLVDYTDLVDLLMEKIFDDYGNENNITGYRFKKKGVEYEVVKQEREHVWVKVLNRRAMAR